MLAALSDLKSYAYGGTHQLTPHSEHQGPHVCQAMGDNPPSTPADNDDGMVIEPLQPPVVATWHGIG